MASVTAPASPLPVPHAAPAIVRIEPPRGWLDLRLGEVWAYRELLYFFVWRDVKVRYKQTAIGVAWVVLQPLLTMGVFNRRKSFSISSPITKPALLPKPDVGDLSAMWLVPSWARHIPISRKAWRIIQSCRRELCAGCYWPAQVLSH